MFRKVTLWTLLLTLLVIVFGASVRMSDTDTGCPDWSGWPACYGEVETTQGLQRPSWVPEEVQQFAKQWMQYRFSLALIGVFILFLTALAWMQKTYRLAAVISTHALLIVLGLQFFLGMWGAKAKMMPVLVTGQLLLGFLTFWLLYGLYLRANPNVTANPSKQRTSPHLLTKFAILGLVSQIVLGFWVTTNQAGLACADFPRCNGTWMPAVNYLYGLDLVSAFKSGYTGVLSFDGQLAIHWLHRAISLVCFILLTWVMLNATSEHYPKAVRKSGLWLSFLLLVQFVLGIMSINFELPVFITVAHTFLAALLMLPLIAINFYSRYGFIDAIETEALLLEPDFVPIQIEPEVEPESSLFLRLKNQLGKTRSGLGGVLASIPIGQKIINTDFLEEIETNLLMADLGMDVTTEIIEQLTERLERHQLNDGQALETALKQILLEILAPCDAPLVIPQRDKPYVILVVGINGVGKTTTIGKLAKRLKNQGHSVMLAAGDTFRAAAVEQLQVWGERNEIYVVAQHTGADSASVIYDAVQSAQAKNIDVIIADTAGRLHTKSNLMEELSKIKRITAKVDASAPHEILLVLDAGTGQNAISQTKTFNDVVGLTGLAVTKLDGTAKGGVMFALANQFKLPIRFIGVGEGIDDLQDFDAKSFVDALFVKD